MTIRRRQSSGCPDRDLTERGSAFDGASERFARSLASRFTRRSFLGDVGKGGIALALGGAVGGIVGVEEAAASHCSSACACTSVSSVSVRCDDIPGYWVNDCPSGSCLCGNWCSSSGPCSGMTRWRDCCGNCGGGMCIHAQDGVCRPKCCYHKEWSGGCGDGSWYVKCRKWTCDC
jgi:hypothetical protein